MRAQGVKQLAIAPLGDRLRGAKQVEVISGNCDLPRLSGKGRDCLPHSQRRHTDSKISGKLSSIHDSSRGTLIVTIGSDRVLGAGLLIESEHIPSGIAKSRGDLRSVRANRLNDLA